MRRTDGPLAIIGHSGFVGGTLYNQVDARAEGYNSQNIEEVRGRRFDMVVCAGAPGAKWKANREPATDLASIGRLVESLCELQADRFVLISTVDVYPRAWQVDEASAVDEYALEPYGRHRYQLEQSVRAIFPNAVIVRLPGLFGKGLKKNFIYDLMNGNALNLTHYRSTFQFYDMSNLWTDIGRAMAADQPLMNFATEPVIAADVALRCFGIEFRNETEKPAVHYDMRTRFASTLGASGPYLYSATDSLARIAKLAQARFVAGMT
jgi:nucleoside-diphosphate-sugar epimerase